MSFKTVKQSGPDWLPRAVVCRVWDFSIDEAEERAIVRPFLEGFVDTEGVVWNNAEPQEEWEPVVGNEKLAKALYELHYSIGAWVPLKQKAYYREQLQIVRDAMSPDPLLSDRDLAEDWLVDIDASMLSLDKKICTDHGEIRPPRINFERAVPFLAALIAAHREAAVKAERERCALQVDHYVSGRLSEIEDLKNAITQGDGK